MKESIAKRKQYSQTVVTDLECLPCILTAKRSYYGWEIKGYYKAFQTQILNYGFRAMLLPTMGQNYKNTHHFKSTPMKRCGIFQHSTAASWL